MTKPTFAEVLKATGLSNRQFRKLVEELSGYSLPESTISRWKTDPPEGSAPAMRIAIAFLRTYSFYRYMAVHKIEQHEIEHNLPQETPNPNLTGTTNEGTEDEPWQK